MERAEDLRQRGRRERQIIERLRTAAVHLADAQVERTWAIVSAHQQGLSIRQIAAATGLSSTRVHQLLTSADVQEIPVWRQIAAPLDALRGRAEALVREVADPRVVARPSQATVGGGSLPGQVLPSVALAIEGRGATRLLERLRQADPAVIGRVEAATVLLDLRSVESDQDEDLRGALERALAAAR